MQNGLQKALFGAKQKRRGDERLAAGLQYGAKASRYPRLHARGDEESYGFGATARGKSKTPWIQ